MVIGGRHRRRSAEDDEIDALLQVVIGGDEEIRPGDIVQIISPGWLHGDVRRVNGRHHSGLLVYLEPKTPREHARSLYFPPRALVLLRRGVERPN